MIEELEVLPGDVALALELGEWIGTLNNSITHGEGNGAGKLGELLVARRIGASMASSPDFDLITPKGHTIDVKTKRCTSIPRPEYECSIAAFNPHQACDYYVFVRVLDDLSRAWLLGAIPRDLYFRKAVFRKSGEVDPNSQFGWTFKADCYNLPIDQLSPVSPTQRH